MNAFENFFTIQDYWKILLILKQPFPCRQPNTERPRIPSNFTFNLKKFQLIYLIFSGIQVRSMSQDIAISLTIETIKTLCMVSLIWFIPSLISVFQATLNAHGFSRWYSCQSFSYSWADHVLGAASRFHFVGRNTKHSMMMAASQAFSLYQEF